MVTRTAPLSQFASGLALSLWGTRPADGLSQFSIHAIWRPSDCTFTMSRGGFEPPSSACGGRFTVCWDHRYPTGSDVKEQLHARSGIRTQTAVLLRHVPPSNWAKRAYPGLDSNQHCTRLERVASCRWATRAHHHPPMAPPGFEPGNVDFRSAVFAS